MSKAIADIAKLHKLFNTILYNNRFMEALKVDKELEQFILNSVQLLCYLEYGNNLIFEENMKKLQAALERFKQVK